MVTYISYCVGWTWCALLRSTLCYINSWDRVASSLHLKHVWFCKLPQIITDTLCCAKLEHFVWIVQETEGRRPWSSKVSSTMLEPVFAIQIVRDINKHREGKDMPLLLHLILCSVGKRPGFCRNRCSIWWGGCSLRGATVSCFMFRSILSVTKMAFYCVFEFTVGSMLHCKKEIQKGHKGLLFFHALLTVMRFYLL